MSSERQVPGPYEDTTCQMVMAYGNSNHRHLEVIREFRDEVLKSSDAGRKFTEFYYRTAPFFTSLLSRSEILRKLTLYLFAIPSYVVSRVGLRFMS